MRVMEALTALGARAHCQGGPPATEAEYLERVAIEGDRPAWSVVEASMLSIARGQADKAIQSGADAGYARLCSASAEQQARHLSKLEDARILQLAGSPEQMQAEAQLRGVTVDVLEQQLGISEARQRLKLEADARGIAIDALVALIEAKRLAAKDWGSRIEALRAAGKTQLGKASSPAEIDQVAHSVIGELNLLGEP